MQMENFDPLDPKQRAERGRERTAFFRQTDMFPIVVLTMAVFVPLALWYKPLAIPFLGWMVIMVHVIGGLDRFGASLRDQRPVLKGNSFRAALVGIALFAVLSLTLPAMALLVVGGLMVAIYLFGAISGRVWLQDETR
ncbi:MAG: hypothetical protein GKR97_10685 [Rhizobiaceae bacterium]|nr:hypothetical protein [Rhizobiaceae bacterium]